MEQMHEVVLGDKHAELRVAREDLSLAGVAKEFVMARPKAYKGHNPLYGHACAAFSIHSATAGVCSSAVTPADSSGLSDNGNGHLHSASS